jgi:hypothetical protein
VIPEQEEIKVEDPKPFKIQAEIPIGDEKREIE